MSETGPILSLLWESAGWAWLFRAELLGALACGAALLPVVREAFRGQDRRGLWAFAAVLSLYLALLLTRTGGQFQSFEDWEELYAGKLAFQGDAAGFLAMLRHGTTYPFLLADAFRLAGPSPETAVFLNLALLAAAPPMVFAAAALLFRGPRAPLAAMLLFCAWPGLAEYGVLVQGKPGVILAGLSAFTLAAALAAAAPRPASFCLLFLTADLAAKTRQEFGVLYPLAFLLWYAADKDRRRNWWIPALALLLSLPYIPLLLRGYNCHISPVQGAEKVPGGGLWWALFPAGLTAAALAGLRGAPLRAGAAALGVLGAAALCLSAVYSFHPGGPQSRLFLQLAPLFCAAAGPALASIGVLSLLPFLVLGGAGWAKAGAPHPPDTPAAMARLAAEARRTGGGLLFSDLQEASEWKFRGAGTAAALDGEARFLRPGGKGGLAASAGYSVVSGRTVWVAARSGGEFWENSYPWLAASGAPAGEFSAGGWRLAGLRFPGRKKDPAGSKALSDRAVEHLLAGRPGEGEAALAEALKLNPENTDALLSLAGLSARRGDAAGCRRLVREARELMPDVWGRALRVREICGPAAP